MLSMSAAGIAALDCFYNMLKESNCPDFFLDQNDASVYPMMKFRDSFTYAMNLIKAGAGWFVEHNDTLFIIPLPQMKFDNQNRLHSSDSPAINWIDGIREYYWHDVRVDSRLVLNPRSITIEEFIATRNVEHRRVMAERIGLERIFSEANVKLLDSDIDYSGERQLLRLTLNSDEPIVVVKVICPSTGRVYFLRVPPDCTNIQNAIAWTFGLSGSQYKPVVET